MSNANRKNNKPGAVEGGQNRVRGAEREEKGGQNQRLGTATADGEGPEDQGLLGALDEGEERDEDTEFFEKEAGKRYHWDVKAGTGIIARPVGAGNARAVEAMQALQQDETEGALCLESLDLHDLECMRGVSLKNLRDIQLSRNMVSNIDILNQYKNLETIDASNCYIEDVNFNLPKLVRLDLSNNYLRKFPILENMQRLVYLNLNSNKLVEFQSFHYEQTRNIKTFDIGGNMIEFEARGEFQEFLTKLTKLPGLQHLIVDENPFFEHESLMKMQGIDIKEELIKHLKNLEELNGDDMVTVQKQMEKAQVQEEIKQNNNNGIDVNQIDLKQSQAVDVNAGGAGRNNTKMNEKSKNIGPPPSLDNLLYNLEAANGHPSYALDHLKDLANDVDKVIEKLEMVEQYFAPGKMDAEIEENVETFQQNSVLLIDNHFELQGIMLSILAKLSIIKFKNFGLSCFNTLKDLMNSGKEMEKQVIEVLKNEIINKMKQQDPTLIPVSLLKGLHELIEASEISSLLSGMFEMCFPVWLRLYCEKIEFCRKQHTQMGNHDHFDAIIQLLAVSVHDEDNVRKVIEKELPRYITIIIKSTSWGHDRYIPCLHLIARLANASQDAAAIFMDVFVHTNLITQIRKSLVIYKKYNNLFDQQSKETVGQQMLKFQTLAAEITTLGGLMNAGGTNRAKILDDSVVLDLLSIMGHPKTDPILLTAICTFAYDVFECEEIMVDEHRMSPYQGAIQNLQFMIPYLGFGRYQDLLVMTKRYHQIQNKAPKDQGDDQEGLQVNDKMEMNIDISQGKEVDQQANISSLQHLDDYIVNDLFKSIIRLVELICRQAEVNKSNKLFGVISKHLDDCQREQALFNCLEIPNDDVRLAVVKCLFVIQIEEFQMNEIAHLTKVMSNCNNIGAGKTELVLSTIYWICTKFVCGDTEAVEGSPRIFQQKFGEKTINEAINILQRNLIRIVEIDDEDKEKYTLSLSILNFLKASSDKPMMKKYLKGKTALFRKILANEDNYSSKLIKRIPIDIETTMFGREMHTLIECISGVEAVEAYCDVSLRVIMRMADILMYRHSYKMFDIREEGADDVIDGLMDFAETNYTKKKNREMDFWLDKPARFMEELDEKAKEELTNQHSNFTGSNGVALLQIFLTSKNKANENLLQELVQDCFNDQITAESKNKGESKSFANDIKEKLSQLDKRFERKYKQKTYEKREGDQNLKEKVDLYSIRRTMEQKYLKKRGELNIEDGQTHSHHQHSQRGTPGQCASEDNHDTQKKKTVSDTKIYRLKQKLQFEELGVHYKDILLEGDDGGEKDKQEQKLLQIQEEQQNKGNAYGGQQSSQKNLKSIRGDGFLNKNIRSLTIAAFLRCLYAAIEYAPSAKLRQDAIKHVKDPLMFRSITQLCDSTNWDENANIGGKYIRVMRNILKLPPDQGTESMDMLMHYELIAIVIQKVLSQIIDKMKKDIQLTNRDQVTIYEMSLTFFVVIQQANNFEFSKLNIVDLHLDYERKLAEIQNPDNQNMNTLSKLSGKNGILAKQLDDNGPWPLKCEYGVGQKEDGKKYKKGKESEKYDNLCDFIPEMPDLRKKRTIQNKVVEYLTLKLFSKQSIFYLVDILFKDMKDDYKLLEQSKSDEDEDEEEQGEEGKAAEDKQEDEADLSGEESDDPTRANVDLEEYMGIKGVLTIERIKDIVGEIMSSCQKKMKYEILQTIMKGVIFQKKKLRESFMQEILNAQDSASYRLALQAHVNSDAQIEQRKAKLLAQNPERKQLDAKDLAFAIEYRRIINLNAVDMSNVNTDEQGTNNLQETQNHRDESFYNRIFVLTSKEILIMRNPPKGVRCRTCPLSAFCPTEPTTRLSIKHSDITTVINFPQLPQKLVIQYKTRDSSGSEPKWHLTLNIPTYTKCAKIYQNLMLIVKSVGANSGQLYSFDGSTLGGPLGSSRGITPGQKKPNKTPGRVTEKPALSYVDQLVQYELRVLLQSQLKGVSEESNFTISKKRAHGLQLIYASLQYDEYDADNMLISPKFFRNHIKRPSVTPAKQNAKESKVGSGGMFGFVQKKEAAQADDDNEEAIKNSVLVCLIPSHLILLKEHWDQWQFLKNPEKLREYKKQALKKGGGGAANQELGDVAFNQTRDPVQAAMEQRCNPNLSQSKIFSVVTMIAMSQVRKLEVHRGKDPSVELRVDVSDLKGGNTEKKDNEPAETRCLQILFPGDMERQRFVEAVIGIRDTSEEDGQEDEEKDEGPTKEGEDGDIDEDGEDKELSDEEVIQATIYE